MTVAKVWKYGSSKHQQPGAYPDLQLGKKIM